MNSDPRYGVGEFAAKQQCTCLLGRLISWDNLWLDTVAEIFPAREFAAEDLTGYRPCLGKTCVLAVEKHGRLQSLSRSIS